MSASGRPHLSKSAKELEALYEAHKLDVKVLRELFAELKRRHSSSAMALRRRVEASLTPSDATAEDAAGHRRDANNRTGASPYTGADRDLNCRSCQKKLRVPIVKERTAYHCPECKADFEVTFDGDVVHVTWIERKVPAPHDEAMTEDLAREILGVESDADFSIIKSAWRKASQQYHSDRHQNLPDRLRKAAEEEMKRINQAFQYLEAATASDF